MRIPVAVFISVVLGAMAAASANAVTLELGFASVGPNLEADATIGESQLSVQITDEGVSPGQVQFIFLNEGPLASSITDVYFDDGTLLGNVQIDNSDPGVDFSPDANPSNLPGGNPIGFDSSFSADSNTPVQPNGVNPGESLAITFDLLAGMAFEDVVEALTLLNPDSTLRIGIHVQGFDGEGSESFVNRPVPEPSTAMGLAMFMLVGLVARRRTRRFAR